MGAFLFVVVLVVLIVVHELGHFVAAKVFGIRVEEFGIGYPPRALVLKKKGNTVYTLNWLPFGGFVKLFGEDGEEGAAKSKTRVKGEKAFTDTKRPVQALVLIAGILMNLILAWALFSAALALGMPRVLSDAEALTTTGAKLVVSQVVPHSPADAAGLTQGDVIQSATYEDEALAEVTAGAFTAFVAEASEAPITLQVTSVDGTERTLDAVPQTGIIPSNLERLALGVGVANVGALPLPLLEAPVTGAVITWSATKETAVALVQFFSSIFTFTVDFSEVAGPLGIAVAVNDASTGGIVPLLVLTAIISINLALVNLIPIPALDGGRLLFVIIESITRRPIPTWFAGAANALGFGFLILLMIVITASDLFKLFG